MQPSCRIGGQIDDGQGAARRLAVGGGIGEVEVDLVHDPPGAPLAGEVADRGEITSSPTSRGRRRPAAAFEGGGLAPKPIAWNGSAL
jgi:hypothetical protein